MNVVVLRRRLFYICAMVLLVIPLYFLGNPSVRNEDGSVKVSGGALAQIRAEYDLGQGDLGDIDPASESMRLATLGLRGVAATILWQKAEYYKREQYWDRLSATLNQIAVLQPHFIEIWKFQSHNLSYNVSVQFDNYRHRYQWVKKGMDYLVRGSKINRSRTEMPFELGWFFGNKFGVSDERLQFREIYSDDSDFHEEIFNKTALDVREGPGLGPDQKPDNWLSGRLWYVRAQDMVDQGSDPCKSTMMFYRQAPMWLMKYSEAIQRDGYFEADAQYAWRRAGEGWNSFGQRQILTTWGETIYLTEIQKANDEFLAAQKKFKDFCGDTYTELLAAKEAMLSDEEKAAKAVPLEDRNFEQLMLAQDAATKTQMFPDEVARELPTEKERVEGLQLAKDLNSKGGKIRHIEVYRNQINYPYWEQRCVAEQEESALTARLNMHNAEKDVENGLLDEAIEKYEIAFANWGKLFNTHPAMMIDDAAEDVIESIDRYQRLIDDPQLADDFPLNKFIEFREAYIDNLADPAMMSVIAEWKRNHPDKNFLDEMLRKSEEFQKSFAEADQPIGEPGAEEDMSLETSEDAVAPPSPASDEDGETAAASEEEKEADDTSSKETDSASSEKGEESPTIAVEPPSEGTPPGPKAEPKAPESDTAEEATKTDEATGEQPGDKSDSKAEEQEKAKESSEPTESPATAEKPSEESGLKVQSPKAGSAPGPKKK